MVNKIKISPARSGTSVPKTHLFLGAGAWASRLQTPRPTIRTRLRVFLDAFRMWGSFSGRLTSTEPSSVKMRSLPPDLGQGWMVGANPKFADRDYRAARRSDPPGRAASCAEALAPAGSDGIGSPSPAVLPLSLTLAQCGKAPGPRRARRQCPGCTVGRQLRGSLLRSAIQRALSRPTGESRAATPADLMSDPTRRTRAERRSLRVASLAPPALSSACAREDLTTLVSMKSSAFPYFGNNPASDAPFLNIAKGDRRGHRSYSGRVYWQDETYNDSRVLVHVPETFRRPQARRDRGVLPRQRRDAGARRARSPAGAAADHRFRRQRRAAGAADGRRCRRFQRRQILAARRLQALHGRSRPSHLATLIGDPERAPRRLPTCRS